jgi:hypothetical protein
MTPLVNQPSTARLSVSVAVKSLSSVRVATTPERTQASRRR